MKDAAVGLPRPQMLERIAREWGAILLLAPAGLFSLIFFVAPMAVMFGNSLTISRSGATEFTLANYVNIVTDSFYWEVLLRTMRISAVTTLCALVFGYPAAMYLYFSQSRWRRLFLFIIVSPLFVSGIVRAYGWIIMFSPSGAINYLLPPNMRAKLLYTEGAIVVGLMHIYLPFMVLALNAALFQVDKKLLSAAASLGAANWRIFRDVLFPLSIPGVLSGCILVFAISMTAFSVPVLLGGVYNKTLPFLIYQQNVMLANWHLGSALAFVLLFVTLTIVRMLTRAADRDKLHVAAG